MGFYYIMLSNPKTDSLYLSTFCLHFCTIRQDASICRNLQPTCDIETWEITRKQDAALGYSSRSIRDEGVAGRADLRGWSHLPLSWVRSLPPWKWLPLSQMHALAHAMDVPAIAAGCPCGQMGPSIATTANVLGCGPIAAAAGVLLPVPMGSLEEPRGPAGEGSRTGTTPPLSRARKRFWSGLSG